MALGHVTVNGVTPIRQRLYLVLSLKGLYLTLVAMVVSSGEWAQLARLGINNDF